MRLNNRCAASTLRNNLLYVSGQRYGSDSTFSKRAVILRSQIYLHSPFTACGEVHVPLTTYFTTIESLRNGCRVRRLRATTFHQYMHGLRASKFSEHTFKGIYNI